MKVKIKIVEAWTIKDKAVGVKVKTYEEKMKVIGKRATLKGSDIMLSDDYTDIVMPHVYIHRKQHFNNSQAYHVST